MPFTLTLINGTAYKYNLRYLTTRYQPGSAEAAVIYAIIIAIGFAVACYALVFVAIERA